MLHDILLTLHIAAGSLGLALGPVALWRSRRGPALVGGIGAAYLCAVLGVSLTAVGLVALDWSELWWLTILAAFASSLVVLAGLAPEASVSVVGESMRARRGRFLHRARDGAARRLGPAALAAWTLPTLAGLPVIEVRAAGLRARASPTVASAISDDFPRASQS